MRKQINTFGIRFRKSAMLISGNVWGQVVADIVPLRLQITRARRLGLAPRPVVAGRVMLARLLARVPRRLRVFVAHAVVVAEICRVILEAVAVGTVEGRRALEGLNFCGRQGGGGFLICKSRVLGANVKTWRCETKLTE